MSETRAARDSQQPTPAERLMILARIFRALAGAARNGTECEKLNRCANACLWSFCASRKRRKGARNEDAGRLV